MPKRVLPTTWTANRPLTLVGTSYAKGARIPNAVVAVLRNLSTLVSRNWILVDKDMRGATPDPSIFTPATFNSHERKTIAGTTDPP